MTKTIWIIDDDLVSQFAIRYCVEQYGSGYKTDVFSSAEEALSAAKELSKASGAFPKIILLDLVMNHMNGWEFIDQLKNITSAKNFPNIFILSAFTNAKDRAIAKEHPEVSGYFDKPLSQASLSKVFSQKITQ
ncbi:response regulator [Maribacter sp. 2210JD10-5]|uniref:response regulator n=1 Tax=Maribacter sp. 2210JD10-5 TaxID=3386272 RepID=UPI0039BD7340